MKHTSGLFMTISRELLEQRCAVRFRAEGRSMLPAIRPGEAVRVAPVDLASVRPGDILLCLIGARLIAHRLVEIDRQAGTYTVRGDATRQADAPVTASQILGRVESVERAGKLVRLFGTSARATWRLRQCRAAAAAATHRVRALWTSPVATRIQE